MAHPIPSTVIKGPAGALDGKTLDKSSPFYSICRLARVTSAPVYSICGLVRVTSSPVYSICGLVRVTSSPLVVLGLQDSSGVHKKLGRESQEF
eukprot:3596750-Pyramimonas_sp.AAC.1